MKLTKNDFETIERLSQFDMQHGYAVTHIVELLSKCIEKIAEVVPISDCEAFDTVDTAQSLIYLLQRQLPAEMFSDIQYLTNRLGQQLKFAS